MRKNSPVGAGFRNLLLASVAACTVIAGRAQAGAPSLDVTVKNKTAVIYRGHTTARGEFTTSQLPAGDYTLVFQAKEPAKLKGQQLAIAVQAGKAVSQTQVAGDKFAVGVAMNLKVMTATAVKGQVSSGRGNVSTAMASQSEASNPNVKYIDGKKYVWMPPETGSHMGGKWVPADEVAAHSTGVIRASGTAAQEAKDHTSY